MVGYNRRAEGSAMIQPVQQDIRVSLASICELSGDIRFGQLLANPALLAEDRSVRTLWEREDSALLKVVEAHRADLARRKSNLS
jgi:hypothetical protein